MTQTFATNENNDIFIGTDGRLVVATELTALEFACQTAAQTQLQEMIYAYNQGVAYQETIFQNSANVAQFEASLRSAITSVAGVTGISNFTILVQNNQVTYSATIQTIYGTGEIGNG